MTLSMHGARMIDGTGADPIEDPVITIDGERISSIGKGARADETLDLEGLTLLPGLIDAHTHFGLVDMSDGGQSEAPAVIAAKIFRVVERALDQGFTTCRDAGGIDGGVARAVEEGLIRGPRILPCGPMHRQTGGHGELRAPFDHRPALAIPGLVRPSRTVDGPDEMRQAVREAFRFGATQIKVCVSGGVVSMTDSIWDAQLTVHELRAAVEEAEARGTYVMAHAHNVRGIRNGLEAGVHCFEHASFLDEETAELIAEAGAVIVPTFVVLQVMIDRWREWGVPEHSLSRARLVFEGMQKAVRIAADAGITIGSGSDLLGTEQTERGREIALKAEILGAMGAIVSATKNNAQILGISEDVGTLTEGMRADIIAVDGDPLEEPDLFEDESRIRVVVKNGRMVKDIRNL
ncbi:MAG: amidohydrolase family protein [Actinomycetota bacterium]